MRAPVLNVPKAIHLTIAARSKSFDGQPSCTITTGTPDRTGDVIEPSGVNLANFLKNPVVMFAHDYQEIPVGVCTAITSTAHGLEATWRWLENDPFAERVANAWSQDALRACSVGILPLKWAFDEERRGYDYLESELLEFSICAIPMNPEATKILRGLGLDRTPAESAQLSEEIAGLKAAFGTLTASVDALAAKSQPANPSEDAFVFELADDDPNAFEIDDSQFRDVLRDVTAAALAQTVKDAAALALNRQLGRID